MFKYEGFIYESIDYFTLYEFFSMHRKAKFEYSKIYFIISSGPYRLLILEVEKRYHQQSYQWIKILTLYIFLGELILYHILRKPCHY